MIIMIFKNSKIYDVLKWCCMVVIPALITFFGVLGVTLEWEFTEKVITIATAFNTMLGTILGIGNIRYNKTLREE
jgi:small basic protein